MKKVLNIFPAQLLSKIRARQPETALMLVIKHTVWGAIICFAITALVIMPLLERLFQDIQFYNTNSELNHATIQLSSTIDHHINLLEAQTVAEIEKGDERLFSFTEEGGIRNIGKDFAFPSSFLAPILNDALQTSQSILVTPQRYNDKNYLTITKKKKEKGLTVIYGALIPSPLKRTPSSSFLGNDFSLALRNKDTPHNVISYGTRRIDFLTPHQEEIKRYNLQIFYSTSHQYLKDEQNDFIVRLFFALILSSAVTFSFTFFIGRKSLVKAYKRLGRTQHEIQAKEAQLRNIIDNAADGIMTLDHRGIVVNINPAGAQIFEATPSEVIGRHSSLFTPEAEKEGLLSFYRTKGKLGQTCTLDLIKTGNVDFSAEVSIGRFTQGSLKFYTVIFKDITQRIQAEEEILRSRNFLKLIMENVPDMVFVKDENLAVIEANPAFIAAYPEAQQTALIGSDATQNFSKEQAEELLEQDKKALKEGYLEVEQDIKFNDGTTKRIFAKKSRFEDSAGKRFILTVAHDITQQSKEQELLQNLYQLSGDQSQTITKKIIKTLNDSCEFLDVDHALIIKTTQNRSYTEYTSQNDPLEFTTSREKLNAFTSILLEHMKTSNKALFEPVRLSEINNPILLDILEIDTQIITLIPLQLPDEEAFRFLCFISNKPMQEYTPREISFISLIAQWVGLETTEMDNLRKVKEFNNKLVVSNQELDDFAYIASHDLKEPLRGMGNFARILREENEDKFDGESLYMLKTLGTMSKRMEKLIDSLWNYSRLGRSKLALADTDIKAVVEDVVDLMEIDLNERNAEVQISPDLPIIHCDGVRVQEIFRNLIFNALKYNDKDKKIISVGVEYSHEDEQKKFPVLFVKDNGIGVAPEHQDLVFKIFKSLHIDGEFAGGTGSGLTIVQKIIKKHSGQIWIESDGKNGTTFFFTLNS